MPSMLKIYKETRVDTRQTAPASIVNIPIPSSSNGHSNPQQRRTKFSLLPSTSNTAYSDYTTKDEDAFVKRYLASQGAVYFRQRKTYPRSFLWRVVGGNDDGNDRFLEIKSVDLTKGASESTTTGTTTSATNNSNSNNHPQPHHEANLLLRLEFPEKIIPHGVALADSEDHEVLSLFVVTRDRHLYTISLRQEFFRRVAAIDENVPDWCKVSCPAPLAFAHPHRLHASSPQELFISLDSGALLRLTRKAGDDGSNWSAITFDEKPWGSSLRGLVKWNGHQQIRYDGRVLDPNTSNAIATTSDHAFVFVVGLNHTLKIWNLASHKLAASRDLLNRTGQQQDVAPATLNPSESAFIRVFNAERAIEGETYYAVTYSPLDDGQFKFWVVKGGLGSQLEVEDLFPDSKLKPVDPDPSGSVFWNIADFQIKSMEEGRHMVLWVLWRNNNLYQVYSLHFNLDDLESAWRRNWTGMALETSSDEPPPSFLLSDIADPAEKWLEYLFCPGRYSHEILATSLAIYQDAMKIKPTPRNNKKFTPLQQQLYSTISESVTLRKFSEAGVDYTKYRRETDTKWRQFWQIADDLNGKRNEAISLSYDAFTDIPWLLFSDGCCLIRECSGTELVVHNDGHALRDHRRTLEDSLHHRNLDKELRDSDLAAALIAAAASFRKKFTPELSHACATALNAELFTEPSLSAAQRIAAFHAQSKFAELITDDMFDSMFASVEIAIGFKKLTTELFLSIIDTMPLGFPGKDSELLSTDFGRMVTVQGALETIRLNKQVLYDLLLLTVFVETELTQEDGVLFDGVDLFVTLIEMLKEYEMMIWLGSNVRPWHGNPPHGRTSNAMSPAVPEGTGADKGEPRLSTILEDLFACHIKPRPTFGVPQTFTLTQQIRDVVSWITRQGEVSFPNVLVFIQCDLLASGNIDLASDFLRFQPNTAWSTYVKGRLYVAKSEFDAATIYFQKAAYILSHGKAVGNLHEMSSNLLDIISVNSFYNGLPKYFQHILSLFEQARAFAHVADFARLALQALESDPRKNEPDSDYIYLRTDLLSRLFHASLKTCRFDEAYSALSRYTDAALQKSALTALITTILAASGPGIAGLQRILRFPISLAPNLASHVDEILLSLAKKQSTHGRSQGQALPTATSWQENSDIPDYQRVLQAYRVARNDIRGAAEVSYQAVQRLREMRDRGFYSTRALMMRRNANEAAAAQHQEISEEDLESKNLRNELLSLINLLACMDKNENYILVEVPTPQHNAHPRGGSIINNAAAAGDDDDGDGDDGSAFLDSTMATKSPRTSFSLPSPAHDVTYSPRSSVGAGERKLSITSSQHSTGQQSKLPKRIIVTLEDLRKEYQAELDRVSRIENGDWEFGFVDSGAPDMNDDSLNNVEAMDLM
ncbi:nucleoporin Nup120 [Histoplasma capsulatum G186AR]|nr:nucleoporin Nup120 [Histoplasma capsulatum]QSS67645.1 nucleoporin Nup120 [Histoplasma capsulatum G186AR]